MDKTDHLEAPSIPQQVRWKAMDLLARREHSRKELWVKLLRRYADQERLIVTVLDGLEQDGMLSDERFTEAFVSARKRKGYGPARIRRELIEKGVCRDLIDRELCSDNHDWYEVASRVWSRRFGLVSAQHCVDESEDEADLSYQSDRRIDASIKERSRQIRFMQYRGFSSDQIQSIMP